MNKIELRHLFNKYLRRDPTNQEYDHHLKRNINVDHFEKELANCEERKVISMNSNTNIAFLVTGHVRHMQILDSIVSLSKMYNIDVFVFTWDNVGIKGKETDLNDRSDLELIRNKILKIPNLRSYRIENNAEFIKNNDRKDITYFNHSSPEVFIKSQLYAVQECYKLMEEYAAAQKKEYHLVLKTRMDSSIKSFSIDADLLNDLKRNIVFAPNKDCGHDHPDYGTGCWACDTMYYKYNLRHPHIFEHTNVVCDFFAYGNMEVMKKYCSLFEHYDAMNIEFLEGNMKSMSENPELKPVLQGNVYKYFDPSPPRIKPDLNNKEKQYHIKTLYYLNCSYPERMLPKLLKNYMMVSSEKITMRFYR